MNDDRYKTAAVLALVKMGLVLLMAGAAIFMASRSAWAPSFLFARSLILILAGGLEAYILLTLRRLLWERYDFHRADRVIVVLAVAAVVLEILNQITEAAQAMSPGQEGRIIAGRILFVIIPWGVIIIVFAASLLQLRFAERSLLRYYVFVNLAAGIILISMSLALAVPVIGLMLYPLLVLTEIGSGILLALTFLRSEETERPEFV